MTRDCKVALTSLLRAQLHVDVSRGAVQVRRMPSQAKPRGICSPGQSRLINLTWTFYVSTCASHLLSNVLLFPHCAALSMCPPLQFSRLQLQAYDHPSPNFETQEALQSGVSLK